MPVENGHGQSVATAAKQYALHTSLGKILGPIVVLAKRYQVPCVVADMTAGDGIDGWGRDGSPLIIAKHVTLLARRHDYPIRVIYTDRRRAARDALRRVMSERYPELDASYFCDQGETVEAIPVNARGLTYFDPNGYNAKPGKPDGLDDNLLARLGRSHARVDILITRECQAGYRMQCAPHCPGTLTIQDYLARTGKKRQYILPYADYHWWTMGFADNWTDRLPEQMRGWVDVHGPEGPRIYAKWTKGMESEAANARPRHGLIVPPSQEELPWGA